MKRIYVLLTLLASLFLHPVAGQDFSNKGKEFWLAYSYHVGMVNAGGSPTMTLYLSSDVATTYTVEIYGVTTLQAGTITAGQVVTVNVPTTYFINGEGSFAGKAIRITADKPIVVYSFITRSAASAATLCLPLNVLGREYYSANFTQVSNEANSHSYITIVGVEDNTAVEITPTANTKNGWLAGTTYTVNLNKGQIYQVLGALTSCSGSVCSGLDLTGTKIKSVSSAVGGCKRIAVFSGSGKISIGCNGGSADNLYQQLYPTSTWGKKYLTAPSYSRPNNYFRIMKSTPAANVYLNGTLIPSTSFVNNFYYEFINNTPNKIEADQPICVAQYFTSQGCSGNSGNYDPDMIVLNPVEQNIDKVTLVTTSLVNTPAQHNIHVIMRNAGTGLSSFKLDNNPIPLSSWLTHPADPNYSYTYLSNVSQSTSHRIESDSGFNAVVYGYANAESYGYSAGANVKDLYQFASIQNQYGTVNFPSTCRNSPFFFSMTFPYQPTSIRWEFGATLNAMGIADVTVNSPVYDSTWVVSGKQLYRYKLTTPYYINAVGTYSIKIFAQNPTSDGCNGEQEINFDVQVYEKPTANFGVSSTSCVSDSVTFTDSSNTFGRPKINYLWNFGDGQSYNGTGIPPIKHLYASAGTYDVKYAVVSDIGCLSDTATKTLILTQPPVAKFGIGSPRCVGKNILLTDSSTTTGATISNWTWNFGDGSTQVVATTNASQPHTYAAAGTYIITLQVQNANGCLSKIDSMSVTVSANPVANFGFGKACLPGGAVQFTDASTISDGTQNAFTYAWSFGDGGNGTGKTVSHNYSAAGPYSALLVVTSGAGCIDSVRKTIDSVYAQPKANFPQPAPVCFGNAVNFTDQSTAQGSSVAGQAWDFGDGTPVILNQSNPTHNYSAPGTYKVKHWITSAVGCSSDTMQRDVVVNALPKADFLASSPTCVTRLITFTDKSVANSGNVSEWTWNFGDGSAAVTASNGTPQTHTYAATGTYQVTLQVKTDKGCVSKIDTVQVVINPLPVPGFIMPGNCVNDPVSQFFDTTSIADGSQNSFTYSWNFGDANANGANPNTSSVKNPTHKFIATGNYNISLKVTSNAGCADSITQVFTINGAVPVSGFVVQNGLQHCSNDSVRIQDTSSVFPGRIVKLEIYWDYTNDPSNKLTVTNPALGATYAFKYPEFFTPATKDYAIRVVAYSGLNCLASSQKTVTVLATPDINFPALNPVCADVAPFQIQASATNMTGGTGLFTGTALSNTGTFTPRVAGAGTYTIRYTYTSANSCTNFKEQSITVYPVPTVNAGPDKFILEGGSATLTATATGTGLQYLWTPNTYLNSATAAQPVTTPADDITYTLTVTSTDGCTASDAVFVKVLKAPTVPNVFTPNGDGVNDKWDIQYLESYPGATVDVFNRYGSLVFHSQGYAKPWDGTYDGKQMPAGTYYYIINPKNGRKQITGFVDIVR